MMRLLLAAAFCLWAVSAVAQPNFSMSNHKENGSAASITISVTTGANETIKLATIAGDGSPTSVVPTGCATWTQRYAGASGTAFISLYEASVITALSACTVTITASGGSTPGGWIAEYGSFSGVNAVINDTNFTAAAKNSTGTSSLPTSATFSTAQTNDLLLGIQISRGDTALTCSIVTGGSGTWTAIQSRNAAVTGGLAMVMKYSRVTATQSSIAPAATVGTCTVTPPTWVVLMDALTADTPLTGHSRMIQ